MSNRRNPRSQSRRDGQGRRRHTTRVPHPLEGMEPWLWAMQDADEAERLGDVDGALAAIRRRFHDPDGRPFWRQSRIYALLQLRALGPVVPGWGTSRWILAQALQHLADDQRGPHSRNVRAVETVVDLHGGDAHLRGRDRDDKAAWIADHDWVYRQLHLYELGGLQAFLRGASPDLVAGADRIREWVGRPMGGFVFVESCRDTLIWMDLATRTDVVTPNIGTAEHLVSGDAVIGRVVPVEDGVMFEGPLLDVPRSLAEEIAAHPARWLDLLRTSGLVRSGEVVTERRETSGPLTDVAELYTHAVLSHRPDEQSPAMLVDDHDLARAALVLARGLLDEEDERARHLDGGCPADEGSGCPVCLDDGWYGWAHLHAALIDPGVVAGLPDVVRRDDLELLGEVQQYVAEPARSLVARLIEQAAEAA